MKNIHLLPTDKPSRLSDCVNYKHLYITSDEEIKEGDKIINPTNEVQTCIGLEKGIGTDNICWIKVKETTTLQQILNSQKIILTTDQDLIKDGVQAIDDEFLEWFVKNPSCESVEVDFLQLHKLTGELGESKYKIIIPQEEQCTCKIGEPYNNACCKVHGSMPQEEPKQENCCTPIGQIKRYVDCVGCDRKPKQNTCEHFKEVGCIKDICTCNTGPKQESVEEAAERWYDSTEENKGFPKMRAFKEGAKWQEQRMYSEEDLREAFIKGALTDLWNTWDISDENMAKEKFQEWFEQLKKK